jgi:hypothetical protein
MLWIGMMVTLQDIPLWQTDYFRLKVNEKQQIKEFFLLLSA